jgi:hypothetical protein
MNLGVPSASGFADGLRPAFFKAPVMAIDLIKRSNWKDIPADHAW